MIRFIYLTFGFFFVSLALADDNLGVQIPIVSADPDGGIVLTGKSITTTEADILLSPGREKKYGRPTALMTLSTGESVPFYGDLTQLDLIYGGDGIVYPATDESDMGQVEKTKTLPNAKRHNVIDLDKVAQLNGPIELFKESSKTRINLKNGRWVSVSKPLEISGCPPQIIDAMDLKLFGKNAVNVTFSNPWIPSDFGENMQQFSWYSVGANGYLSTIYDLNTLMQNGGIRVKVVTALNAVTPEKISVWTRFEMLLPKMLAKIAGGSQKCRAIISGYYQYQG